MLLGQWHSLAGGVTIISGQWDEKTTLTLRDSAHFWEFIPQN